MTRKRMRGRGMLFQAGLSALGLAGAGTLLPLAAAAKTIVVQPGQSIQSAVEAADPGDTIRVEPGVYTDVPNRQYVVGVNKDGITIKGPRSAIIDATGFRYGIMVGEVAPINRDGCPETSVRSFRIQGLTIRNADHTGLRLVGVDGFSITDGSYVDNAIYGPFPVCSRRGVIARNFASGHDDAAIYVGDDDQIIVKDNTVTDSTIGIEIENSTNAIVRGNRLIGNTGGLLVVVLPNLPFPFTRNVRIQDNWIVGNDRPNPFTPGLDAVSRLPAGTGILNVGGDNVEIRGNHILENDTYGVVIIGNPFAAFDNRIEPFPDDNRVWRNTIVGSGDSPDPERALAPASDVVFIPDIFNIDTGMILLPDPSPGDNCFQDNEYNTDEPDGVVEQFPCP